MRTIASAAIALSLAIGSANATEMTPGEKSWVAAVAACLKAAKVPEKQDPPACAFNRNGAGQLRLHCLDSYETAGNKCLAGNGPKPPKDSIAY